MSIDKIIKGDWYLQEFSDVYTNIVRSNQGEGFETVWVCDLHGSSASNRPTAKLISAAPDMYSALESSLQMLEQFLNHRNENGLKMGNVFLEATISQVKDAMAKAII
jgi:hypothetical protein